MTLALLLAVLAALSLVLTVWHWAEARVFPLHQRQPEGAFAPPVTIFKPLRGCDAETEHCLRSWLAQDYAGDTQVLFGVAAADDPVVEIVRRLQAEFPRLQTELLVCPRRLGTNAKVSTLAQLEAAARHPFWIVSDADVRVPPDLLRQVTGPLRDDRVGMVSPVYALGSAPTLAMRWEAVSVNADFWSSVLQARRLQPLRFALGAVMAVRRTLVQSQGGFAALANVLADDYELGRRVAAQGASITLCPVVVTCEEAEQGWGAVWRHQLRWSRTIRVCQPGAYAASMLSNATLWPLLWGFADPHPRVWLGVAVCLAVRMISAGDNQARLTQSSTHWPWIWLAPVKDLLHVVLWALAFLGNTVEWRGERLRVLRDGVLAPLK